MQINPDGNKNRILNILLNGQIKGVPDGITVLGLLELLNIQHQRVAVERNDEIVKKDAYGSTRVMEGDRLEVVSFMQGGRGEFGVRSEE
jgi:thiamine biosynthesis protein ThiS